MDVATSSKKGVVLEMCYHPQIRTRFYEAVEKMGWKVLPGMESMICQGVAQQVLRDGDEEVIALKIY
jgi:quinate dehydrogenase